METAKQQKNPSRGTLLSVSATRERHKTCSDLLFDVSIDLDEVVGTIAVMSQFGVGRNRDCGADVNTEDLCACLRLLERRLTGIRARVQGVMTEM